MQDCGGCDSGPPRRNPYRTATLHVITSFLFHFISFYFLKTYAGWICDDYPVACTIFPVHFLPGRRTRVWALEELFPRWSYCKSYVKTTTARWTRAITELNNRILCRIPAWEAQFLSLVRSLHESIEFLFYQGRHISVWGNPTFAVYIKPTAGVEAPWRTGDYRIVEIFPVLMDFR
jgi:hypothetical protein